MTQPLSDSDIIRSVLNEENKGEVDSDNETNEPADEPVTRRQTMDALKILRRALEQSDGSDEQYTSNTLYRVEIALLEFYVSHSCQTKTGRVLTLGMRQM